MAASQNGVAVGGVGVGGGGRGHRQDSELVKPSAACRLSSSLATCHELRVSGHAQRAGYQREGEGERVSGLISRQANSSHSARDKAAHAPSTQRRCRQADRHHKVNPFVFKRRCQRVEQEGGRRSRRSSGLRLAVGHTRWQGNRGGPPHPYRTLCLALSSSNSFAC